MAEIELHNVTKRYAGVTAVEGASLTVRDGEFFILVGPSGCGKSTLLNLIVGLEEVTSGEIRVDGRLVNGLDPRERNMAMVFQSYAIYPHMTVRQNLAFPLKLAKLSREEIERRVTAAAAMLELTPLLHRKPRALSGGQRQRVAMGRAIVREPRVFLLDEPLSNLDARLRNQMRAEIARMQRRLGITTLYVTHDQTEALTLGHRIAVLNHGKIQQVGTPRELYDRPANLFVAGFIGSPAMNFLPARAEAGRVLLPVGAVDNTRGCATGREGRLLLAGFRPEHLQLVRQDTDTSGRPCFAADVAVMEWLGAELFVHFDIDLRSFSPLTIPEELGIDTGDGAVATVVARIDPGCGVREGQELTLSIPPDKLLLFDAASGELIG